MEWRHLELIYGTTLVIIQPIWNRHFLEINTNFCCCHFFRQDVDQRYLWCEHAHRSVEDILRLDAVIRLTKNRSG